MSQENVEVVRRAIAAFIEGDYERLIELSDPQVEYDVSRTSPESRVVRGPEEVLAVLREVDRSDADRLTLLDRIANRVPELDLEQNEVEWMTLDDGHEALLVNGGGIDGGNGAFFVCAGDDLHVVGVLDPLFPAVACIVIKPDGTRVLAHAVPDPLAQ